MKLITKSIAITSLVVAFSSPVKAEQISGAGATFPYPVYSKWADAYKKETGIGLNYQAIGSGGGIRQIKAKTVTFGASDAPLSGKDLDKYKLIQFPMVMGGIVPVVNLKGITPGKLKLDGKTLADIFSGDITKWDDSKIKNLNPDVKLPSKYIAVIHRSDGSGTTFNFSYYLASVSANWKSKVGVAKALQWPVGIGAKGNAGVAVNVRNTLGSIGYVEYAYAIQNKLTFCDMINKDGTVVSPSSETFKAAASNADWSSKPGYGVILANQPGKNSWPMTAATWILMYKNPVDINKTKEAINFFSWAYTNGKELANSLDYVPMPDDVAEKVRETWKTQIK